MSFFEGGRKTINQTTTTYNRQAAVQGSGNFVATAPVTLSGSSSIHIESLDPLALEMSERVATAAVQASQKYVEFSSESNRLGLQTVGSVAEHYADVAKDVAQTAQTPEQLAAKSGGDNGMKAAGAVLTIVALAAVAYYAYKKLL